MDSVRAELHRMIDELSDEELQRWLMDLWKSIKKRRIETATGTGELPSLQEIFERMKEIQSD